MWYNDIKHTNHTLNNNKCAYVHFDIDIYLFDLEIWSNNNTVVVLIPQAKAQQ